MRNLLALLFVSAFLLAACEDSGSTSSDSTTATGTGGSTARMTISGDYLYAIAGDRVQLFTITTPEAPAPWTQVQLDWDIQTLFPYGEYLLVGAADGMHIVDNTDPGSPRTVGDFQHARTIDPVVAQNDIAYVTLKEDPSSPFNEIINQMNVIDISDMTQPVLLETIPMQGPAGLAVSGDRLYVCDGVAGLKTFDITVPVEPSAINALPGINCSDVIVQNNLMFIIETNRLTQYDVATDIPVQVSTIGQP